MIKYSDNYKKYFNADYLMGPNSVRLLDELLIKYPVSFNKENHVLDLGCGKGLTSLFIAKETGAMVYANDLWIEAKENAKRFSKWNVSNCIISSHEDATVLSFEQEMFDMIISVDSYHYFAGEKHFFEEKILPYVKKGGMVLICVPGIKEQYEGKQQELLTDWVGEEYDKFHSCGWWKDIISGSREIEFIDTWEMDNFDIAWDEWLETDNEYALGDKKFYQSHIKKYTTFVGIAVKKKQWII